MTGARESLIGQIRRVVPIMPGLPLLIRARYATTANRWAGLAAGEVSLLREAPGMRGQAWPRMLAEHGIADVASMALRDRYGCWAFLDLWRQSEFTRADADALARIARPAADDLRSEQAATFAAPPGPGQRAGPLVLLLDRDLAVRGQTPATHEYLRALVPPSQGQAPIPAAAYNVAAQLLAATDGVDKRPARARVHLAGGRWLTLRAAFAGDVITVTIEQASPAERAEVYTRACGLSERELVGCLAEGLDTRAIAAAMFLSEHTVQDHLKSIFDKTGARSRKTLLSRAAGS
jgi:DNA-binding CsgD family transcriptional regulator